MRRVLLLAIVLPLFSCTHAKSQTAPELARKGGDRGLFVGHTSNGVVVVAAKHYDAMNGLAVLSEEIEGTNTEDGGQLLCRREMITGSHYPTWLCRYKEDDARISEENRNKARMFLQSINQTCTDGCVNR